jgi:hypothetical protein
MFMVVNSSNTLFPAYSNTPNPFEIVIIARTNIKKEDTIKNI